MAPYDFASGAEHAHYAHGYASSGSSVRLILSALEPGPLDALALYLAVGGKWDVGRYDVHLDLVAGLLKTGLVETKDHKGGSSTVFALTRKGRAFLNGDEWPPAASASRVFLYALGAALLYAGLLYVIGELARGNP